MTLAFITKESCAELQSYRFAITVDESQSCFLDKKLGNSNNYDKQNWIFYTIRS